MSISLKRKPRHPHFSQRNSEPLDICLGSRWNHPRSASWPHGYVGRLWSRSLTFTEHLVQVSESWLYWAIYSALPPTVKGECLVISRAIGWPHVIALVPPTSHLSWFREKAGKWGALVPLCFGLEASLVKAFALLPYPLASFQLSLAIVEYHLILGTGDEGAVIGTPRCANQK